MLDTHVLYWGKGRASCHPGFVFNPTRKMTGYGFSENAGKIMILNSIHFECSIFFPHVSTVPLAKQFGAAERSSFVQLEKTKTLHFLETKFSDGLFASEKGSIGFQRLYFHLIGTR